MVCTFMRVGGATLLICLIAWVEHSTVGPCLPKSRWLNWRYAPWFEACYGIRKDTGAVGICKIGPCTSGGGIHLLFQLLSWECGLQTRDNVDFTGYSSISLERDVIRQQEGSGEWLYNSLMTFRLSLSLPTNDTAQCL